MEPLLYPSSLPEKCRTCPAMQEQILQWNLLQTLSDNILATNCGNTKESIAVELCDEMVNTIARASGEPLNPGIDADRVRAAELLQTNNGRAFEAFTETSQSLEESMKNMAEACGNQGPLEARVASRGGSVIVALCRGHIAAAIANPGAEPLGAAGIRSEIENNDNS